MPKKWYKVADVDDLPAGQVTTAVAGYTAVCLIHTADDGFTALDNRCPHQGGPLGEGQLDGQWLICPWHGYEYDPQTGQPPAGYGDYATALGLEVREDGIYVEARSESSRGRVSATTTVATMGVVAAMVIPAYAFQETAQEQQVVNNLKMLAAAADQYFLDTGKVEVKAGELIGEDKYISDLTPVAGENYKELVIKDVQDELRVSLRNGRVIVYNYEN